MIADFCCRKIDICLHPRRIKRCSLSGFLAGLRSALNPALSGFVRMFVRGMDRFHENIENDCQYIFGHQILV